MKFLKPKYIVFIFPFLLYINTVWNGYSFDDNFVTNNETVTKGISAIPEIFTGYYFQEKGNTFGYRPVVRSMYAVEYSLFGDNPAMSHFISILLYSLLCLVIYRFLKKLFPDLKNDILILIVILFASHPVHTEAVASLKNREEILAMLFGILALTFYSDYIDRKNYLLLIPVPVLIFIAVLTKENSLTYPILIPLVYLVKTNSDKYSLKRFILPAAVTFVVFVAAWVAWKIPDFILPPAEKILYSFENPLHAEYSYANKFFLSGISLWFYITILFLPYPLRYYYGYNMFPDDTGNVVLSAFTLLFCLAIFLYSVFRFRQNKNTAFFILFFLISISVFTNFFIPVNGITGERLAFQASLGFCGAVVVAVFNYFESRKKDLRIRKRILSVFYIIIAIFSIISFQRNKDWKTIDTILNADIDKLDNSAKGQVVIAAWNLGQIMKNRSEGKYVHPEAINKVLKHYRRSIEISPDYYSSYNNIGTIYLHILNRTDSALVNFKRAVEIKPDYTEALYNCGISFINLKKTDSALFYINKAISSDSSFADSWLRLSDIYISTGDSLKAFSSAEQALKLDTVTDKPLITLGNLNLLKKDTTTAVKWWEQAISKNPRNPALLYGLSKYFLQKGDIRKSENYSLLYQKYKK